MLGGTRREMWVGFKRKNYHSKFSWSPPSCSELSVRYGHIGRAIFPGKRRTQNMHKCSQDALEQHNPLRPLHIAVHSSIGLLPHSVGTRQRNQRFTRQQLELSNSFKISSSHSTITLTLWRRNYFFF